MNGRHGGMPDVLMPMPLREIKPDFKSELALGARGDSSSSYGLRE